MDMTKYHRFVNTIEATEWFREHARNGDLELNYSQHTESLCRPGSLGRFTGNEFLFSCKHFAVTYTISQQVVVDKNWHTLRHINQRNSIINRLLGIISRVQEQYLLTRDPITLLQLPYLQIVDEYKALFPRNYMDVSIISRVVRNNLIKVHGKTISFNELLPRKSYLVGLKIMQLLKSTDDLLTDEDLRKKLANKFDRHVTRRYVSYCRNLMGIPEVRMRKKINSKHFSLGFSRPEPLRICTLALIPEVPGVYGFNLVVGTQIYGNAKSSIIYIGSSRNLNKRIKVYLNGYGHTNHMREFIETHSLNICFLETIDYRKAEARLIHNFVAQYGELPLLNMVKPKIKKDFRSLILKRD